MRLNPPKVAELVSDKGKNQGKIGERETHRHERERERETGRGKREGKGGEGGEGRKGGRGRETCLESQRESLKESFKCCN